jgi:hypothetical protein
MDWLPSIELVEWAMVASEQALQGAGLGRPRRSFTGQGVASIDLPAGCFNAVSDAASAQHWRVAVRHMGYG